MHLIVTKKVGLMSFQLILLTGKNLRITKNVNQALHYTQLHILDFCLDAVTSLAPTIERMLVD